ncbi:MAG: tetratricopeptide repeat protein, partial [Alphaproteobacteria bacterium]|nr:tetratricopeptide repeat protein [Alphaproteobacteria bacterium]
VQGDYTAALAYTQEVIEVFNEQGSEQNRDKGVIIEWDGTQAQKDIVSSYGALNDVATAYFIQGVVYKTEGDTDKAFEKFNTVIKEYSFAQVWDNQGYFWSVAKAIIKEHGELFADSVLVIKDTEGWRWVIDGQKQEGIAGIVYQPVPDDKHINDFKGNYSELYKALLDVEEGGQGHAQKLDQMGVEAIRIYELGVDNSKDISAVKEIFGRVFDQYGIRVMVGSYLGLYDEANENYTPERREQIKADVAKLVLTYADQSWYLASHLGNENNFYLEGGRFAEVFPWATIDMDSEEYYLFVDEIAKVVKETEATMGVSHPIVLGNGSMTIEESVLIGRMQNIDVVGGNFYESGMELSYLFDNVNNSINRPIIVSEFGVPSNLKGETAQANDNRFSWSVIWNNMAGNDGYDNVLGAFLFEFSDEAWKQNEGGITPESHYGIVGKEAENIFNEVITSFTFQEVIPTEFNSQAYVSAAWDNFKQIFSIDSEQNSEAINAVLDYTQRSIDMYMNEALIQNGIKGEVINWSPTMENSEQIKEKIHSFWALNDVATNFYIIGIVNYMLGNYTEAEQAFTTISEDLNNAQIWDSKGWFWSPDEAVDTSYFHMVSKFVASLKNFESGDDQAGIAFSGTSGTSEVSQHEVYSGDWSLKLENSGITPSDTASVTLQLAEDRITDEGYITLWVKGTGNLWFTFSQNGVDDKMGKGIWKVKLTDEGWQPVIISLSSISNELDVSKLDSVTINFGNSMEGNPLNTNGGVFYIDDVEYVQKNELGA